MSGYERSIMTRRMSGEAGEAQPRASPTNVAPLQGARRLAT